MAETNTAAEDAGHGAADTAPHATLDELVAEPERVTSAADTGPVRIDRPGAPPLVLVSAAEFDRLTHPGRTRSMLVTELTEADIARMHAQPMPSDAPAFDHEGDFPGHG